MHFGAILLLSVGLAMDAMAVSAARGLAVSRVLPRHVWLVAGFFGGAQALMPLLGWIVGSSIGGLVEAWDHWIAFSLLAFIGTKMLWEARTSDAAEPSRSNSTEADPFAFKVMSVLAIATSIDALAAGITLPILGAPLLLSLVTIGVTTATLSALGLYAGRHFGKALGKRLDVLGGVVIIGLGIKILVEHLSI
jgi:putative Mn2+ efflux pump MntP